MVVEPLTDFRAFSPVHWLELTHSCWRFGLVTLSQVDSVSLQQVFANALSLLLNVNALYVLDEHREPVPCELLRLLELGFLSQIRFEQLAVVSDALVIVLFRQNFDLPETRLHSF